MNRLQWHATFLLSNQLNSVWPIRNAKLSAFTIIICVVVELFAFTITIWVAIGISCSDIPKQKQKCCLDVRKFRSSKSLGWKALLEAIQNLLLVLYEEHCRKRWQKGAKLFANASLSWSILLFPLPWSRRLWRQKLKSTCVVSTAQQKRITISSKAQAEANWLIRLTSPHTQAAHMCLTRWIGNCRVHRNFIFIPHNHVLYVGAHARSHCHLSVADFAFCPPSENIDIRSPPENRFEIKGAYTKHLWELNARQEKFDLFNTSRYASELMKVNVRATFFWPPKAPSQRLVDLYLVNSYTKYIAEQNQQP